MKPKEIELNISVDVNPRYLSVRKSISEINFDNELNYFKTLIYLALDTEYNARIAQLYQFLKSFNSKDKKYLLTKLNDSETYSVYNKLEQFNPEEFLNGLYTKIGEYATISEMNKLNKTFIENNVDKIKGYEFIKIISENEALKYFNKWKKLFSQKNIKHRNKMDGIIDEVINEKFDLYKNCFKPFDIDEKLKF